MSKVFFTVVFIYFKLSCLWYFFENIHTTQIVVVFRPDYENGIDFKKFFTCLEVF